LGAERKSKLRHYRATTALDKNQSRPHVTDIALRFEVALLRERALERQSDLVILSIHSGKDCRAAILLVQ